MTIVDRFFTDFDRFRGNIHSSELVLWLLAELAHQKTGKPRELLPIFSQQHFRPSFSEDVKELSRIVAPIIEISEIQILELLDKLSVQSSSRGFDLWVRLDSAKKIAEFAEGARDVRCSFGPSTLPAVLVSLARYDKKVRFVSKSRSEAELMNLMSMVFDLNVDIVEQDPFLREDGPPADFELSMPPFNMLYQNLQDVPQSILRRLGLEKGKARVTGEVLALEDALENKSRRQAVLVAPGTLFRNVGVEKAARGDLLYSGRLHSVLRIPSGMAFEGTAITSSLLILDGAQRETASLSSVRFVDLQDTHFSIARERGRYEVRPEASWVEAVDAATVAGEAWARDVSIPEIEERGGVLTPDRFFAADTEDEVSKLCAGMETFALSDLAEIIRPAPLLKDEDGEFLAREAAAAEIDESGFVLQPSRASRLGQGGLTKAADQRLAAGDVVLAVKGTIGAVGLVPEDAPAAASGEIWVPGQSLVALRIRKGVRLKPVTLFEILSSDVMRDYIKSLATGSAVQTLSIKDVKALKIPVPSLSDQSQIEESFWARQNLYAQIRALREAVENARNAWPYRI
ncbi:N-6 DNA methylase [Cereibacter azotoformans]|uniref:N-6 DNA methylase n=1 Tax=Cereibacter azotoformans TaxID=43057 RepID=UPI000C6DF186|nr:N-6 DNA methylase [Cereibacter azotoformans]